MPATSALSRAAADPQRTTPVNLLDLEAAAAAFDELQVLLDGPRIAYAVKANPHPQLLALLARLGAWADVASPREVDLALEAKIPPERISYGNPDRSAGEVDHAWRAGVQVFVADSPEAVRMLRHAAPAARVMLRLGHAGAGAAVRLERFGTDPGHVVALARQALEAGLRLEGLCWHVGSQQCAPGAWRAALATAAGVHRELARAGIEAPVLNIGGGLPSPGYATPAPPLTELAASILDGLRAFFPPEPGPVPDLMVEPGRFLAAGACALLSTVKRVRWEGARRTVTLDAGPWSSGLVEQLIVPGLEHTIHALGYPETGPRVPTEVFGPTCDQLDHWANPPAGAHLLPVELAPGDRLLIANSGAYVTNASTGFCGYPPVPIQVI